MKTTLEIPDTIFRRAKSAAAQRGIPLGQFVTEAVRDKLRTPSISADKPWMQSFGKLRLWNLAVAGTRALRTVAY
ncbi:MAG: hypothetical protein DMG39_00135 [Acidobacteria bacterium]|nr:MAG: hypothetical protein DMG39_00135 [Acidobacteriota bacterium]